MIDIKEVYDNQMLTESGFGNVHHLFENGDLTFADMRDMMTKLFNGDITISEQIDGVNLLITYKDGKFCVARDVKHLKDPLDYDKVNAKYCDSPEELKDALANSLSDMSIALSELDPVQLNKFFANGQNFLECQIVYPPLENVLDYGNKCFIALNGIKCFNDKFKEVGEDKDSADQLFEMLKNNGALKQDMFEITKPNILRLKNMQTAKETLDQILEKLNGFIDGVGWKCSLNQYIQDRYSRHIVNKALEHGIDVSRNSDFVNSLAQRLSQVSGKKPTKSDLITYAKCDGVDYRSDGYKQFIQDLEDNCDTTNSDIIKPIEDLIMQAGIALMKNLIGYMALDPSKTAKKLYAQLDDAIRMVDDGQFQLSPENIDKFKKNLAKVDKYYECMPASGIVIKYRDKPYKLTGNFGPISEILNLIKYK